VETYSSRSIDVLSEQDALGLDNEKVDELVHIANQRVEGLLGDGVILSGSQLGREAVVQNSLARNLGGNGNSQHHPSELETPPQKIEVPKREDQ
jgi:hypothetical protein